MPAQTHLLERAYQLINANQLQDAGFVLDAIVRVDPKNVKAWNTYLMIYQNQNDLDWVKERILKTRELSETDKIKLINYHLHLTSQLNGTEKVSVRREPFIFLPQEETEAAIASEKTASQFELLDTFDYPVKVVKREIRTRPRRRRAIYNPFAIDMDAVLKAVSRAPFGRKIAGYAQKTIALANDLIKDPKNAYIRFSKSPYFEKYAEVALLGLFVLGVRLFISSHFLGYVFLGIFIYGGRWWMLNYGTPNISSTSSQLRVYLHENKINLPVIKEVDQEQKLEKENLGEAIK